MRVSTERAEELVKDSVYFRRRGGAQLLREKCSPVFIERWKLAADLLEARKLLKDMQSLPLDDWSRTQIGKTAGSMIENYFKEED